jgi:hypothetical protein
MTDRDRGQLSMPVVEAVVGVVLVLGVVATFTVGVPGPARERAQLERYAGDAATGLSETPARTGDMPFLARTVTNATAFRIHRDRLRSRVDELLPDSVLVRLRTPYGTVGPPRPPDTPVGRATATTVEGSVTVTVWYA